MKHLLLILSILFFIGCSNDNNASTMTLKFDPVPGKTYRMTVKTVSTTRDSFGVTGDTLLFEFDLIPKLKDTMGDRITLKILRLNYIKSRNKIFSHESAKAGNQKQNPDLLSHMEAFMAERKQIMDSLEGETMLLIINKSGHLIMEDGFEELVQNVSRETNLEPVKVRRTINDYLSAAAMKDFLKLLFYYLPGRQIKEKDTWVDNTIFDAMAPVKHSNLISVDTIMDNKVYLKITAQLSAGEEGDQYLKGLKTGTVTADHVSGFPLEMQLNEQSVTTTASGEIIRTRNISVTCKIK